MAIEQKIRSLHCGIPAGVRFRDIGGVSLLPLEAVPYELEDIIAKWIIALPEEFRADVLHFVDGAPIALTHEGWEAFVSWMLFSLNRAQWSPNFEQTVAERAVKSLRPTFDRL